MKKKIISAVIAISTLLSLVGMSSCNSGKSGDGDDTTLPSSVTTEAEVTTEDVTSSGITSAEETSGTEDTTADSDVVTTSDDPAETTAGPDEDETVADLLTAGKCNFVLVREKNCEDGTKDAVKKLKSALGKLVTDGSVETADDSKKDSDRQELLIGNTNRTESVGLFDELGMRYKDYFITVSGNKIIICSQSGEGTLKAVDYFIENYLSKAENGNLTVSSKDTVVHREKYEMENPKLNGVDIKDYTLVTAKNPNSFDSECLDLLRSGILAKTGYLLPVITDGKSADHEIMIGELNRKTNKKINADVYVDEGRYTVKGADGDISVTYGHNVKAAAEGANALLASINETGDFKDKTGSADVGKLLLTAYGVSDVHNCFAMLDPPYVFRKNVTGAIKQFVKKQGPADVFLMGGDLISDYPSWNSSGHWPYKYFLEYRELVQKECAKATKDGKVFYVAGNHDYAQGELAKDGPGKNGSYNSFDFYNGIMDKNCGTLAAGDKFEITGTHTGEKYLLAYHYEVNGVHIMALSPDPDLVYNDQVYGFNKDSLKWVDAKLKEIDPDGTEVILFMSHYVIKTRYSNGLFSSPGQAYNDLAEIMNGHKNLVYLYGHNHTATENMAKEYTSDIVFATNGKNFALVDKKQSEICEYTDHDYISAYMGAGRIDYDGKYGYLFNNDVVYGDGGLGSRQAIQTTATPKLGQSLYIKVYEDRLVFQYLNYGTYDDYSTDDIVKPYTIYLAK
ncbi:MAG: metallophosphoesterase [Firmicutes bacterium]|nr:metallophosphoesterase [Candidatus Colimorpha enterica]